MYSTLVFASGNLGLVRVLPLASDTKPRLVSVIICALVLLT